MPLKNKMVWTYRFVEKPKCAECNGKLKYNALKHEEKRAVELFDDKGNSKGLYHEMCVPSDACHDDRPVIWV